MIDRNSIVDAQKVFEKLLPEQMARQKIIEFLSHAISYADKLNSQKWNLDKNGQFIRFNTGLEYCIQISKKEILILCNRISLKPIVSNYFIPIKYRGHVGKQSIESDRIDNVPDCLAKTKDSVGCILQTNGAENYLDYLVTSNKDFIKDAIKTHQRVQMREAHSRGAIEYLAQNYSALISNPIYAITNLPTILDFIEEEKQLIEKVKKLSSAKRKANLQKSNPKPKKTVVSQSVFVRSLYVVVEVLERANGICERCGNQAPFLRDNDNTPFLEVHHIVPLAEDGDDTVENAIGLCPNCHRHAHYGKMSF